MNARNLIKQHNLTELYEFRNPMGSRELKETFYIDPEDVDNILDHFNKHTIGVKLFEHYRQYINDVGYSMIYYIKETDKISLTFLSKNYQ